MKFVFTLILSLLFIDNILGCKPFTCPKGYYKKCVKQTNLIIRKFHHCLAPGCKCVKIEDYDDLLKIKTTTSNK